MQTNRKPAHPFARDGGPVVLAHRGWRGRFPENTLLSLQKAAELPIDGLEVDIHSSADGHLMVIHDPTVNRTTNGSGRVNEMTLAQLKALDAGYRWTADGGQTFPFRGQGITIPTVAELFATFPHLWINVDIKQERPSIVKPFADLIRRHNLAAQMCVGSFSEATLAAFRQEMPEVAKAAGRSEVRRLYVLNRLRLGSLYWGAADVMQIPEESDGRHLVTRRFVQAAHRKGTAVHVWTVNETADMARLLALGVDGLITDYPDRLLQLLGRMASD